MSIDESCSPWITCTQETAWSLFAKALRTTREDELKKAFGRRRDASKRARQQAWNSDELARLKADRGPRKQPKFPLPQLTDEEKREVDAKLRAYTLMDYLYRLRIKTQYMDSTMFTDGPEDDDKASQQVHEDLRLICAATGFLHELHIGHLLPPGCLIKWADDWTRSNAPPDKPLGIRRRLELLGALLPSPGSG